MTWTAPNVERHPAPWNASEREMLEAWLDFHRETLQWKCSGLTSEQLRRRAVEPSNLSLLGLVRHMSEVERIWFRRRVAGEELPYLYRTQTDADAAFENVDAADPEHDLATYQREVELARAAARTRQLDDTFINPRRDAPMQIRWVYVHMIEGYARHNGTPTCSGNASTAQRAPEATAHAPSRTPLRGRSPRNDGRASRRRHHSRPGLLPRD